MALPYETPARVWRRIQEGEEHGEEMPSLPSFPGFDDSLSEKSSISLSSSTSRVLEEPEPETQPEFRNVTTRKLSQSQRKGPPSLSMSASSRSSSSIPNSTPASPDTSAERRESSKRSISVSNLSLSRNSEVSIASAVELLEEQQISHVSKTVRFSSLEPVSEVSVEELESFLDDHTEKAFVPASADRLRDGSSNEDPLDEEVHFPAASSPVSSRVLNDTTTTPKSVPMPVNSQERSSELVSAANIAPEDPATPFPRKRSFLMNIINSSARPRLVNPTPHPHAKQQSQTPQIEATPASDRFQPIRANRERGRLSHPLSQVHMFIPVTPNVNATDETEKEGINTGSPGDGGGNNSFVSTASSHDLTVHLRANASFDPVMGLQGQGGGVGRFNAGKLNTYLHGLNRKLQEENEILVKALKQQQEECLELRDKLISKNDTPYASGDAREKEALQIQVNELQIAMESKEEELSKLQEELADERHERARDKERWKDRMTEVERGVGNIVKDLEVRLQEAEETANALEEKMKGEVAKVDTFSEECERLREKLKVAEERLVAHEDDDEGKNEVLRSLIKEKADAQQEAMDLGKKLKSMTTDLEDERRQREEKETEVAVLRGRLERIQDEVEASLNKADEAGMNMRRLEDQLGECEFELKSLRRCKIDLESQVAFAEEKVELLQEQLSNAVDEVTEAKAALDKRAEMIEEYELNGRRKDDALKELENALEEKEVEVEGYLREISDLKTKILTQEARSHELSSANAGNDSLGERAAVHALQDELCEANREIGRLRASLEHSQSPTSKARTKAKEERIAHLQKENEELQLQIQTYMAGMKDKSMLSMGTPKRRVSFGGMSPMYRQLMNMTLKTPRTPGEPLKDVSWLHTTMDVTTSPLVAEIHRLQDELDKANESIDEKIDRLEEAGLGVVGLTTELERARAQIVELEERVAKLARSEQACARRLKSFKCAGCGKGIPGHLLEKFASGRNQVDTTSSLLSETSTSIDVLPGVPSRSTLQDTADRLNSEIMQTRQQLQSALQAGKSAEGVKAQLQKELAKAKSTISDLEDLLMKERSKLRKAASEESSACRERDRILSKLRVKESAMEDAKKQLRELKLKNKQLEVDIKSRANVDQYSEKLEEKLQKNKETLEKLRQDRSRLAGEHAKLQQNLAESTKNIHDLAVKHASLQCSYDNRRQQLDLQTAELDELRLALTAQSGQLKEAQSERKRMQAERMDLQAIVSGLENDLQRVRRDAETYGQDLRKLKRQKEDAEAKYKNELEHHARTQKQSKAQIKQLREQLETQCSSVTSKSIHERLVQGGSDAIEELKIKHNKECKGLFVQIRYLKAKYLREATLRGDLTYQKQYLLVLLARYERSEKRIVAAIAQVGFPKRPPSNIAKKTLRSCAQAVIFVNRTRRAAETWREQRLPRGAVLDAFEDVRRKRVVE